MGRYAFFSTDLEYKFAFGVQASEDMQEFGGRELPDTRGSHARHAWTADDIEPIREALRDYEEHYDIKIPSVDNYTKNLDGTHELRYDMEKQNRQCDAGATFYTALLGALILHQLLYEPNLTVSYEL